MRLSYLIITAILASFLLALTVSADCADSQRILRLSSAANAHAELYNYSNPQGNYSVQICYNELFGVNYTGINPQSCLANDANLVLRLAATANAHSELPDYSNPQGNYSLNICYGDLQCYSTLNPACAVGERVIVSLASQTNSHVANDSSCSYKICCSSASSIQNAFCGDGVVNQVSEQCDDGNSNDNDACRNNCTNNPSNDITPPTINYVSPTENDGSVLNRNYIEVNVTASDEVGGSGLAQIIIRLYNSVGQLILQAPSILSPNYQNIPLPTQGNYTFNAYAADNAGNRAYLPNRTVAITTGAANDTTPPIVSIISPTAQAYNTGNISIDITLNEPGYCEYTINNGITNRTMNITNNFTRFTSTLTNLANGSYTLIALCNDMVANVNNGQSVTFTISTSGSGGGGSNNGGRNNDNQREIKILPDLGRIISSLTGAATDEEGGSRLITKDESKLGRFWLSLISNLSWLILSLLILLILFILLLILFIAGRRRRKAAVVKKDSYQPSPPRDAKK